MTLVKVLGGAKQLEEALQAITDLNKQIYIVVEAHAGLWLIQHAS